MRRQIETSLPPVLQTYLDSTHSTRERIKREAINLLLTPYYFSPLPSIDTLTQSPVTRTAATEIEELLVRESLKHRLLANTEENAQTKTANSDRLSLLSTIREQPIAHSKVHKKSNKLPSLTIADPLPKSLSGIDKVIMGVYSSPPAGHFTPRRPKPLFFVQPQVHSFRRKERSVTQAVSRAGGPRPSYGYLRRVKVFSPVLRSHEKEHNVD